MRFIKTALLTGSLVVGSLFSAGIGSAAFAQNDPQMQQDPVYDSAPQLQKPSAELNAEPGTQSDMDQQSMDERSMGQPRMEEDQTPQSEQPLEQPQLSAPADEESNVPPPPAGRALDRSAQTDPPGRAARLQYMSGSVSVQPHGTDEWVQGAVNRPLTMADNIWADKDSKAELNVGTGLIRIGAETSLTLTNVNDSSVQLSLHQGALNVHVRHLYNGEIYEVDTPNQAFTILKTGDYRFDVNADADSTVVTVWHGEGEATGKGPSVRVKSGEQARFTNADSLAYDLQKAPRHDGFDDWCEVRDKREDNSLSARYVSPDVIGSEDLDDYGRWRQTPEYGPVWTPTAVAPGWAPYSYGHWIWQEPWGWTWVDDAPWGFAPFHYGRWVSYDGGWGWAPGPYYGGWSRGWYAPALVAWFGGPHWGVGLGFGGVGFGFGGGFGWCALGFGEPFVPWYHAGWGYYRNVNVYNTRISNINNFRNGFRNGGFANQGGFRYANMNVRGGFTAVNRGTLERGLPVHQNAVRLDSNAIRNAPALSRPNAMPTLQSRLGPNAGRPAAAAPARAFSRPVATRMTPPAASRTNSSGSSGFGGNQSAGLRTGQGGMNQNTMNQSRMNQGRMNQGLTGSSAISAGGRNVPRPPQSFARSNSSFSANGANRGMSNATPAFHNVPRPPSASGYAGNHSSSEPVRKSMNRPSEGSMQRAGQTSNFGRSNTVPRPTGQVQPAPRQYSNANAGRSAYSSRSYGQSAGRSGTSPSYGGSSSRYGSPNTGRSYSGGSSQYSSPYSGRSYGGSSSRYSSPYGGQSYGGGHSYGSASSGRGYSGGGGSYSARSYGGGGHSASSGGSRGNSGGGSRGGGGGGHSGGHR